MTGETVKADDAPRPGPRLVVGAASVTSKQAPSLAVGAVVMVHGDDSYESLFVVAEDPADVVAINDPHLRRQIRELCDAARTAGVWVP